MIMIKVKQVAMIKKTIKQVVIIVIKKCIRGNDDNDNKEQGDDIENYIYDCKGEGITSNPRSSR